MCMCVCWILTLFVFVAGCSVWVYVWLLFLVPVLLSHSIFLLSCYMLAFCIGTNTHTHSHALCTALHTIQYFDSKAERVRSVFFCFCFIRRRGFLRSVWQIFIMYIFIIAEETVSCAASAYECVLCVCKLAPLSSVCDGDWTIRKIILINSRNKERKKRNEVKRKKRKDNEELNLKSLLQMTKCVERVLLFIRPAISIVSEICK